MSESESDCPIHSATHNLSVQAYVVMYDFILSVWNITCILTFKVISTLNIFVKNYVCLWPLITGCISTTTFFLVYQSFSDFKTEISQQFIMKKIANREQSLKKVNIILCNRNMCFSCLSFLSVWKPITAIKNNNISLLRDNKS